MKSLEKELFTICSLVDLFILNSCLVIFCLFRFDGDVSGFPQNLMYFIHFNFCWIIAYFAFAGEYIFLHEGFSNRIYRITKRVLIFTVIASLTALLFLPKYYPHHYFVEFVAVFYSATIGAYFALYKSLKYKRKKGLNTNRAVIISDCKMGNLLRRIIESNPILGYKFLGFIAPSNATNQQDILGPTQNLEELIKMHQIQMIFSVQNSANQEFNQSLASKCEKNGVRIRFVKGHDHQYKLKHNDELTAGIALINPHKLPLDDAGQRIWKRLFDIFFSAFVIIFVFTWLFPIVALMIKLTSKGPVFFYQKRTGINNKTFTCIKFRSMKQNILSDIKQATAHDNRITPVGQFLRDTWIDELPQFINVFLGQMSVVGPRPHMLRHTEQYTALIKNYLSRHWVKPGITGWAQISGYRGETYELWKMEKRVEYDLFYIKNWSFYWDIKIIWRTFFRAESIKIPSIETIIQRPAPKEIQKIGEGKRVSSSIMSEV